MTHKTIATEGAPKAIGPYSQGVRAGGWVFTAGQAGVDPATGRLVADDIAGQTRQTLKNVEAILAAGGATLADVVKTTVFLQDMNEFAAMNAVYAECFAATGAPPPARSTVQAARLPIGARVEIEAVAFVGGE